MLSEREIAIARWTNDMKIVCNHNNSDSMFNLMISTFNASNKGVSWGDLKDVIHEVYHKRSE